jgi:hypothetical protein
MERDEHAPTPGAGTQRLLAHAADCDECQRTPLPAREIGALLDAAVPDVDVGALSQHAFGRARPLLHRRRAGWSWQLAAGLLLALLPLPVVVAYDAYVLHLAYEFLCGWMPAVVAAYLVLSYAATLVLLFATTYAAIPLLVNRRPVLE